MAVLVQLSLRHSACTCIALVFLASMHAEVENIKFVPSQNCCIWNSMTGNDKAVITMCMQIYEKVRDDGKKVGG